MKNLWQFIVNNIHLLLFMALEVVAFLLVITCQPYPQSTVVSSANLLTASVNQAADDVASYFLLRQDNESLHTEIARLEQQVQQLQNQLERYAETDSLPDTTLYQYAHWGYQIIPAKVIDITTHQQHNSLTLNKGLRDGIQPGMGVMVNGGVVGVVDRVSNNFSLVVPLIHTSINVSARILKNDQTGFTHWLGHDITHVQLSEIGRHISVEQGDTVVTSGLTSTFPEGLLIGVMDQVNLHPGDNYYDIRLSLHTDYHHLRYVQVLHNTFAAELDSLSYE